MGVCSMRLDATGSVPISVMMLHLMSIEYDKNRIHAHPILKYYTTDDAMIFIITSLLHHLYSSIE